MSSSTKALDPAFQGLGQKAGIDIWRIENFQPVPLPKSDYGKFHVGDSYIVLWTSAGKAGSFSYDIHFWIGKETSQDEAGTAAIKTVELDMALGGRAVQHRELQGHESDKFLSYFKPCIIPLEGGVASGFREVEKEEFETRLYVCKGKRVVRLKQVPFARSSLNHDDIFILDTENKIFQFNGEHSNIQERAKALEVIQYLKEQYHDGTCNVAVVDDGKLDTESDSGEFWVIFGGFAPLGRKVVSEDDITPDKIPAKLYSISDGGEAMPLEGQLSKAMLENSKCYLLDCGDEVFVWVGRATQLQDRKVAGQVADEFVSSQNRPKSTRTTRIIQGYETRSFKSHFDLWPAGSATPAAVEGRGRVAALLKQQGMDVKGSKSIPVNEEVPPLLEGGGKMEVWYIDGSVKCPLPKEDVGKFHTGDCYIALYSYHAGDRKEEFLCCWIGKKSQEEDQKMAIELADKMFNSLKGRPVQGRIFEGKEPPQFTALFQPMVVLKGGMSSGYRNELIEKGLTDESYDPDHVALFRLSGTSDFSIKGIQVDAVATSLNSTECFVLQSESTMFTWNGNKSTYEQQQLGSKIAGFLKPGGPIKHIKEGTESSAFWSALGGKQSYTSERASVDVVREPHLFTFSFNKEKFEFEEVYNFCQDDLLTEDTLILDTQAEVFVWVGQCVDVKEKQKAFQIGQKYLESAASLEGLPPDVPLYKVPEGSEPCYFTTFFQWDHTKAVVHGNSFQKKATLLFGASHGIEGQDTSSGNHGPRQRAEALAALTSAFNSSSTTKDQPSTPKVSGQGSQRAAAVAALSSVLSAEAKKITPDGSPGRSNDGTPVESSPHDRSADEMATSEVEGSGADEGDAEAKEEGAEQHDVENKIGHITFSYEQLKAHSENPATGIDFRQREAYMENEEFEAVMGMTKEAFYGMPKWKQDVHKKKVDLF